MFSNAQRANGNPIPKLQNYPVQQMIFHEDSDIMIANTTNKNIKILLTRKIQANSYFIP